MQRIAALLDGAGMSGRVVMQARSTRSAEEAAAAIGCSVAAIVKSLVFQTEGDRAVLVLASGANRVDEAKLAARLGEKVTRPDAAFVRARTGFAIGGVAPIGHAADIVVLIDRDLLAIATIWAAAGHPQAVFRLTPDELQRLTQGEIAELAAT